MSNLEKNDVNGDGESKNEGEVTYKIEGDVDEAGMETAANIVPETHDREPGKTAVDRHGSTGLMQFGCPFIHKVSIHGLNGVLAASGRSSAGGTCIPSGLSDHEVCDGRGQNNEERKILSAGAACGTVSSFSNSLSKQGELNTAQGSESTAPLNYGPLDTMMNKSSVFQGFAGGSCTSSGASSQTRKRSIEHVYNVPVCPFSSNGTAAKNPEGSHASVKSHSGNEKRSDHEERLKMEAMINSAVDPIIQIDSLGRMLKVNPACCQIFKYNESQLLGQNVKMLMPDSHACEHDSYLANYVRTGQKKVMGSGRRLRGRRSDGTTFAMFLSLSEARINDKIIFTGIVRDLSVEEEMREKMEAMIVSAVDPIVQISETGIIQIVNPACCRVFKYSEDQMIGQNVKMLMLDNHAQRHDEYLQNYLRTGVKNVMGTGRQLRGRKSDGTSFPIFLSLSEASVGDSKKVFTGIIRDLSAEEEMRQKMEAMIDSAVDPIVQIDHKGIMRMVNTSCCRVFKYKEDHLVGQNVKMLMPEQHASQHDEYLMNYLRTGEKKVMGTGRKLKGRKSDGSTFPMFLSLSEAKVDNKKIFTGIIRDLSAETEERQKMEAMINSAVDPIVQIDTRGIIQMINPACCKVFKYEEHQLIGQNVRMLMPENHSRRHDEYLANYLSTGIPKVMGTGRQLRGRKSDGSTFAMFLSLSEARLGDKIIFTGIMRDLTIQSSHRLYRFDRNHR